MTSNYYSLLKVRFFGQRNFVEISLTAAPNWDNKKTAMAMCGLQADQMGYFECILELDNKVFNYF